MLLWHELLELDVSVVYGNRSQEQFSSRVLSLATGANDFAPSLTSCANDFVPTSTQNMLTLCVLLGNVIGVLANWALQLKAFLGFYVSRDVRRYSSAVMFHY